MKQRTGRPPITVDQVPPGTDPRGTDLSLPKTTRFYWRHAEKRRKATNDARRNWTPERRAHHNAVAREWRRRRLEANPELRKITPEVKAWRKAWRDKQRDTRPEEWRRQAMAIRLKSKYGVPIDRYDALLEAQGGVCAVCRQPETVVIKGTLTFLGVDHDHLCCPGVKSCGKCVRGLLCSRCNRASGIVGDDPARLRALADYIDAFRA